MDGIEVVLVAVGLFAVGEAFYNAPYEGRSASDLNKMSSVHMTRSEWRRSWPAWLRGTFMGFPFGTIRRRHRDPDLPELRHRAQARQARAPEGIRHHRRDRGRRGSRGRQQRGRHRHAGAAAHPRHPDSVTTAILLSAFQNYGINPGPQLFQTSSTLVWG